MLRPSGCLPRALRAAPPLLSLVLVALVASAQPQGTVLQVTGLTFVGSRDSQNEVVLHAAHALFHPDTKKAQLQQVHAVVSRPGDEPGFDITCDRADLDLDTNDFRAEGSVVGTTSNGRRFHAEWVEYKSDEGLLFTKAPVTIEEASGTLRGGGFRYLVREQRFRLLGGATMVQEP
jgi:LPS export ABC transporter protein LptC